MRGSDTLVPARFLTLLGHLCVLVTLIWESKQSVRQCLPSQYHETFLPIYHSRLVAGLAASLVLIVIEFLTFLFGLTMFSPSVSMISIAGHGFASITLTYFVLDGWLCDWYWPIFFFCTVLPSCVDLSTAVVTNEHQHLTQMQDYKAGWSFYLVLAGVVTTIGSSLPVGFNIGVVNTPAEIIKKFCYESIRERFNVDLDETSMNILWSAVVSIFIVGGCTGSILGSVLADKLGRKNATIVTSILSLAGAVMFVLCRTANSVEMLILGRLLVGLSGGLTTSIVPMYLTELAPPTLTGAMGVACPMGVNVGVLVGQVMGLHDLLGKPNDWPYLLSVFALLVIICLPVLFILPESPKYLYVVKKDEAESLRELSRVRGVSPSFLTDELDQLRDEVRGGNESDAYSMWAAVRDRRLLLPLLLVCTSQAGQQTSGINAVFYYSQTIFRQAGLSRENAQFATIGCGAINVCTAVIMLYLLPRMGRRPLLLGSMFGATIILALLAAAMKFIDAVSWMPYAAMIAVLSYVLVYGFGLGPIPYFIASEIFEVAPRGAGMAWGSLANWGGNFLVGMCFPTMRDCIGAYSFLIFSGVTAALTVFHKLYFPETRGKSPTQVTDLCSNGLRSRPLAVTNRNV